MPPAKRAETEVKRELFLQPGQICNLPLGGRTITGYEYLGTDGVFLKFRGDVNVSPMTEIVLIPVSSLEAVGLVGAYA